jgi:hypothetical protein
MNVILCDAFIQVNLDIIKTTEKLSGIGNGAFGTHAFAILRRAAARRKFRTDIVCLHQMKTCLRPDVNM